MNQRNTTVAGLAGRQGTSKQRSGACPRGRRLVDSCLHASHIAFADQRGTYLATVREIIARVI